MKSYKLKLCSTPKAKKSGKYTSLFENTKKSFLSQNGSSIVIDNVEVLSEEVDIAELYEFGYMKKN